MSHRSTKSAAEAVNSNQHETFADHGQRTTQHEDNSIHVEQSNSHELDNYQETHGHDSNVDQENNRIQQLQTNLAHLNNFATSVAETPPLNQHVRNCFVHWRRSFFLFNATIAFCVNLLPIVFEMSALRTLYKAVLAENQWYYLSKQQYDDVVVLVPSNIKPYWVPTKIPEELRNTTGYITTIQSVDLSNESSHPDFLQTLNRVNVPHQDKSMLVSAFKNNQKESKDSLSYFDSKAVKKKYYSDDNTNGHWEIKFYLNDVKNGTLNIPVIQCEILERQLQNIGTNISPTTWILETNSNYSPSTIIKIFLGIFVAIRWSFPLGRFIFFLCYGYSESWYSVVFQLFSYVCLCILSISLIGTELYSNGCIEWYTWGTPLRLYQWQTTYWFINILGVAFCCLWKLLIYGTTHQFNYSFIRFRSQQYQQQYQQYQQHQQQQSEQPINGIRRSPLSPSISSRIIFHRRLITNSTEPSNNDPQTFYSDPLNAISVLFFMSTAFVVSLVVLIIGVTKPWIIPIWSFVFFMPLEVFVRERIKRHYGDSREHHLDTQRRETDTQNERTFEDDLPEYLSKKAAWMCNVCSDSSHSMLHQVVCYFKPTSCNSPVFKPVDIPTYDMTRVKSITDTKISTDDGKDALKPSFSNSSQKDDNVHDNSSYHASKRLTCYPVQLPSAEQSSSTTFPTSPHSCVSDSEALPDIELPYSPHGSTVIPPSPCLSTGSLTCIVCWELPAEIVADPCGHCVLCRDCCGRVLQKSVERFNRQYYKYLQLVESRSHQLSQPKIQQLVECPLCRIPIHQFFQFIQHDTSLKDPNTVVKAIRVWDVNDIDTTMMLASTSSNARLNRRWYTRIFNWWAD